jgi:ribonuclease BN (tRNA processing enzyme)
VPLPHSVPNLGLRVRAGASVLAYTGDTGPSPDLPGLARGADVFLAEATYADDVPADAVGTLSSAAQAGEVAARSGVGRLVLTHLMPGTDPARAEAAAGRAYEGPIAVARPGLSVDIGGDLAADG